MEYCGLHVWGLHGVGIALAFRQDAAEAAAVPMTAAMGEAAPGTYETRAEETIDGS